MKERFEIYDGSAEAKKAKGKSKNLSGFHPLFTAAARRSIALDSLKIWLLLGFVVGVVTGVATGAGGCHDLLQQKAWYLSTEKHSRWSENDHPDQTVQKQ